jgi:excisionase family DNA binding protein
MNLLDIEQTSNYLRISIPTLRRIIKRKEIKTVRIGERILRFNPSDLDKYIKDNTR